MLNESESYPKQEHDLFETDRWTYMLITDSCYFDGKTDSELFYSDVLDKYNLNVRCNLKNYSSEIEKFLDWLCPFVETYGFLGYLRYEECDNPTLIYKTSKGIEYKSME